MIPHRLVVCGLCSLAASICYQQRVVYFQIVEDVVYRTEDESRASLSECPEVMAIEDLKHMSPNRNAEFYWSLATEKSVRHSFYAGLTVSFLPAGLAADGFGAKGIMAGGIFVSSLLSIAIPSLAKMGAEYIMFGRFFQGVAQGLVFPCLNTILAHWVPHDELSTYAALVHSGQFIGWGFGAIIAKRMSEYWRVDFALSGLLGFCWVLLWVWFASSAPEDNIHISPTELELISKNVKGVKRPMSEHARQYVPWTAIASSPCVLSLMLLFWSNMWLHHVTMFFQIRYFQHVLRLSRRLSVDVTAWAEIGIFPSAIFWGIVSDKIISDKFMNVTTTRKVFTVLSTVMLATCLVCLPLVGCNGLAAGSLYASVCFWRGLFLANLTSNIVEIAPRYAGFMDAVLRDSSAPAVAAVFVLMTSVCPEPSDISSWQTVYLLSGGIMLLLALPYLYFGSAVIQKWNFFSKTTSNRLRGVSA